VATTKSHRNISNFLKTNRNKARRIVKEQRRVNNYNTSERRKRKTYARIVARKRNGTVGNALWGEGEANKFLSVRPSPTIIRIKRFVIFFPFHA